MNEKAYPPELMELMSAAFDAAYEGCWGEPSQAMQLQLAVRIMDAVNAGERDPHRLVAIALGEEAFDGASELAGEHPEAQSEEEADGADGHADGYEQRG
jgi:hypothetical protein